MSPRLYLQPLKPPFPLDIPPSSSAVQVSIIDSTSYIRLPSSACFQPPIKGFEFLECPAYSFLIHIPLGGIYFSI